MKKTSINFSFDGWTLIKSVKGNWKTIKEGIKTAAPFLLGLQIFADNLILIGVVTILGKAVLDAIEFYFSKVEL